MTQKSAIVILGGGLVKDKHGKWRTTNFDEKDKFGALGDRLRVKAGSYLYKKNTNQFIIVLGGKGQFKNIKNIPLISEIIKKELEELGVPHENIIIETRSGNTFEQLKELRKIIKKQQLEEVLIISNEYHLPRIQAIIDQNKELKDGAKIKLQSAEKIIIDHEPEREELIKLKYKSKSMQDRIVLEKKGVQDIKNGLYKF